MPYCEVWERPGSATFGKVIDSPPYVFMTYHDGSDATGNGRMSIPRNFDRFDEILSNTSLSDPVGNPGAPRRSLVRVFDEEDPDTPVFEWLPDQIVPAQSKNDPNAEVTGLGIKNVLDWARVEAWDWDGSANWVPTFPNWIFGGPNVLSNPGMETSSSTPTIYRLIIDATAGTFDIDQGADTSTNPFDVTDGIFEINLENDLSAIDDLSVTPLEGTPRFYTLSISATGGTFVIDSPSDTTGALSAGISAGALETALEALADITDVDVTVDDGDFIIELVNPLTIALDLDNTNLTGGSASLVVSGTGEGFDIEFVNPPNGLSISLDPAGLTGSAQLIRMQEGETTPASWEKSQQVSVGTPREYGLYDAFEYSTAQAHSGSSSLYIDPGPVTSDLTRYAGGQQRRQVVPGGLYQMGIWVYPTAAGQTYALVLRGIDEDLQLTASGANARVEVTPPPNVWTYVSIDDVVPDTPDVIFRFANTNSSGNPAGFYIDDAELREGQRAATIGEILSQLYDDATTDHTGRVMWEDLANPGTSWLTLDFDADVDSNGDPWLHDEIEITLWMRFTYLQVMQRFVADYGYEWRIIPDDVEAGTWLWQVFNPDGMGTDRTADPSPAIQGGQRDTRRSLQRFLPAGTDYLVEGENRVTARATDATLEAYLGRMESSRLGREIPTVEAAAQGAAQDLAFGEFDGLQYAYELTDPYEPPLAFYQIGDLLNIHDPPYVDAVGRLADVEVTVGPEATVYEVIFLAVPTSPSSP